MFAAQAQSLQIGYRARYRVASGDHSYLDVSIGFYLFIISLMFVLLLAFLSRSYLHGVIHFFSLSGQLLGFLGLLSDKVFVEASLFKLRLSVLIHVL